MLVRFDRATGKEEHVHNFIKFIKYSLVILQTIKMTHYKVQFGKDMHVCFYMNSLLRHLFDRTLHAFKVKIRLVNMSVYRRNNAFTLIIKY